MNKSQRIYLESGTTTTDKYIMVELQQEVDSLEFMTLNISTKDAYQDFNSDYGVLVGRVIANDGIGIPNAKISIFIPLTDADAEDGQITSIYPYKSPRDKNAQGKRYNLLPRVAEYNEIDSTYKPKQPFGSFPIKPEIVTNQSFLNVYKKYYKYTATSNDAGDYMIFGVPVGTQTVHMSVDITDIGKYSMTPAAMVTNLGYSPNLFTDNNSKIKPSQDLGDLPNIETQEISVDIIPFWGDTTNFVIGITRQDFRIRAVLVNTFVIFGSVFTDAYKTMWGAAVDSDKNEIYRLYQMSGDNGASSCENVGIFSKITGPPQEKIYYYPANITDAQINTGGYVNQMLLLDKTEYSIYKQNGAFAVILSCNRRKVITNEQGVQVPVDDSVAGGLYTEFKGFMTLEITGEVLPLDWTTHGDHLYYKPIRQILKFPQYAACGDSFRNPEISGAPADNDAWRKIHYTFCGGGIYSVTKFHGLVGNSHQEDAANNNAAGFSNKDVINTADYGPINLNAGVIQVNNYQYSGNTLYQMVGNSCITCPACCNSTYVELFGANWLNMSVYLPQTGWVYDNYSYICCYRANSQFTYFGKNQTYYEQDNAQQIAGPYLNTCSFARSDLNWTDFIRLTKQDVVKMNELNCRGFKTTTDGKTIPNPLTGTYTLEGQYRNGVCVPTGWNTAAPICGGKCNGNPTCATDPKTYFFKGIDTTDCVAFITCLGLI